MLMYLMIDFTCNFILFDMFKDEQNKFLKNCLLTSYAITFDQITFFLSLNLFSEENVSLNLFCYNSIFKDRVLFQ